MLKCDRLSKIISFSVCLICFALRVRCSAVLHADYSINDYSTRLFAAVWSFVQCICIHTFFRCFSSFFRVKSIKYDHSSVLFIKIYSLFYLIRLSLVVFRAIRPKGVYVLLLLLPFIVQFTCATMCTDGKLIRVRLRVSVCVGYACPVADDERILCRNFLGF